MISAKLFEFLSLMRAANKRCARFPKSGARRTAKSGCAEEWHEHGTLSVRWICDLTDTRGCTTSIATRFRFRVKCSCAQLPMVQPWVPFPYIKASRRWLRLAGKIIDSLLEILFCSRAILWKMRLEECQCHSQHQNPKNRCTKVRRIEWMSVVCVAQCCDESEGMSVVCDAQCCDESMGIIVRCDAYFVVASNICFWQIDTQMFSIFVVLLLYSNFKNNKNYIVVRKLHFKHLAG